MTTMVPVPICGRQDWTILMPEERAARVQWPWHEWNRFHSMFHNLRPGDVLFDVGAEQGDQSALYQRWIQRPEWDDVSLRNFDGEEIARSRHQREGGVVLVEPNLKAWPNIRAVWEANELRAPLGFCKAWVGDQSGGVAWPQSMLDDWPHASTFPIAEYVGTAESPQGYDTVTIDDLYGTFCYPDAITIDIEGAELDALGGAYRTLTDFKPLVWVSIHWQMLRDRGQSREELIEFMADLGYRHEHLGEDHEIHALFWHPEGRRPVLPYDHVR